MGILQSVLQILGIETEEENGISPVSSYNWNSSEESPRQWRNGNPPTMSHQMKYPTVSAPVLKDSSSLACTSVKKEAAFVKENAPPKASRRRDEVPVVVKCRFENRWIKHYSSYHRILLVGEGDFSFSTCLAKAFGLASNMVATSLDSKDFLVRNYSGALSNLVELSVRKCTVIHGINATEMANTLLGEIKFDRIIFNFPFAGFFKDLPLDSHQLRLHRSLVSGFMENAKKMMNEDGEIHITHKTNGFHKEWRLEMVAAFHGLRLVEAVDFDNADYEGYNTKFGFGGDNNFNCHPSKTYKFRLSRWPSPQIRSSYTSMIVRCEDFIEVDEDGVPPNFAPPGQSVVEEGEEEEEEVEVQITSGGGDEAVVSAPEVKCSYASIVMRLPEIVEETVPVSIPASRSTDKKKIKHYSSHHKILLVGEGDFSFSACLAVAFGSATNIIATSFDAKAFLKKNYGSAMSNTAELRRRGGRVMYGIDATEIASHEYLRQIKFDRIVFNFPFAGFFPKLTTEDQLRYHRRLVSLFLKNAKEMISENGEIHVSHKINGFHAEFKLESIASSHGLRLIAAVKFKSSNYPGYNTKYGFGGDKNFDCNPSKTFKFGLKLP